MNSGLPIACLLEGGQARKRWQAWSELLTRRLDVDRSSNYLTLSFEGTEAVRAELADLVASERQCCGFVAWELQHRGDKTLLTISGDADGVTAMAESFGLSS